MIKIDNVEIIIDTKQILIRKDQNNKIKIIKNNNSNNNKQNKNKRKEILKQQLQIRNIQVKIKENSRKSLSILTVQSCEMKIFHYNISSLSQSLAY